MMMNNNNNGSNGDFQPPQMGYGDSSNNDLQFTTSVDTSVRQNVPIPSVIPPSQIPMTSSSQFHANNNNNNPEQTSSSMLDNLYKNSAHPIPCLFHLLFKILALLIYIFSGTERFIITTVTCLVFLAMDFWTVKNITGRLLVGLRWWSQNVGEDGTQQKWIFESQPDDRPVNSFDQSVFWTVLYVTPSVWGGLFGVGVLKFNIKWLITVLFGIVLSGANTYGYYQCSKDQKAKWERMMVRGAEIGAFSAIKNSKVLGKFGNFASGLAGFGAASGPAAAGTAGGYANVDPNQQPNQNQQFGQPMRHV